MKYRLGLVSVSFRTHSPEEILRAMRAAGLTQIEWGSDVHAPCQDPKKLSALAALQETYGVTCSSYGTYFTVGKDSTDGIGQYIDAAKRLGTTVLRIWCGTKSSKDYSEAESAALFAQCRTLAEIAADEQVVLCLECHRNTYTDEADAALALMRTVGSPHLQMYWQPEVIHTEAENCDYAARLAAYIRHIHVFHWDANGRYPLCGAIAQWQRYLHCLPDDKTLLLEFMPDDRLDSLPKEAAALRKIAEALA